MYIYCVKKINNPLYIHFLCGNKYKYNNISDKRNILKAYIDSQNNNHALILEKLFSPKEYKKIGFKDLEEVELMASNYAKSIIILHETVSTAAEIALFGSKKILKNKILVIYAPKSSIETDIVGNFIRLAYFQNNKVKNFEFAYKAELYSQENTKIAYYNTFFNDNKLDNEFIKIINEFWSLNSPIDISLEKEKYTPSSHRNNIYKISQNRVNVKLSYEFILSIIIAILLNNPLLKEIKDKKVLVKNICQLIKQIVKDTISDKELHNLDNCNVDIKTIDNKDIYLPVRFCIYILLKTKLITIRGEKLSISTEFKMKNSEYKGLIQEKKEPSFFESLNGERNE